MFSSLSSLFQQPQSGGPQFFSEIRTSPTLYLTTCRAACSGCELCGEKFAKEFKIDSIKFDFEEKSLNIHKKDKAKASSYSNLVIMGCNFFEIETVFKKIYTEENQIYLSSLKNIYIIVPFHWALSEKEYSKYQADINAIAKKLPYNQPKVNLLATGISSAQSYALGMPNPLPKDFLDAKFEVPKKCYGVVCLKDFFTDKPDNQIDHFLYSYFHKISALSIPSVFVYVITSSDNETELLEERARSHGVKIQIIEKPEPKEFMILLQAIGKKGGLVAINNSLTLMQSLLLDCPLLFLSNKACDANFIKQLVNLFTTPALKEAAEKMLGVSNKSLWLTRDNQNTLLVCQKLRQVLFKSIMTFEMQATPTLKPQSTTLSRS